MEDVPHPSTEPYAIGEEVQIYLSPTDPDSRFNDTICRVVDRFEDRLAIETGRTLDAYSYRLADTEGGEILPVQFRHADLIPCSTDSEHTP